MLDVSGIPPRRDKRDFNEHPVILAGGPAVSNPRPYSPFIDAFWIGEAEAGFFDLAAELTDLKRMGESRAALFNKISSHPNIWVQGKEKAARAIFQGFSANSQTDVFPIPSMKTVHHHGTVEIMRGCPNGCRFCHAGFWYRPYRQKDIKLVTEQVDKIINEGGWQEISLSSLSSGDFTGIEELIESLNLKYSEKHVSFQLPSLKVQGFSLDLLEKISVIRKSGLTFAVETPVDLWQISVNKKVSREYIAAILEQAKKKGWKSAKIYFMIGLPVQGTADENPKTPIDEQAVFNEEEEIVSFITDVGKRTKTRFNINIGIFIPKPHTPFQWAAQINDKEAEEKISFIRSRLKPLGHKINVSDTITSVIEGLLSRGDERAGLLCEEAWHGGSRLDPWSEYINKEKWREIIACNFDYISSVLSGKSKSALPWSSVDSGVAKVYLEREFEKSQNAEETPSCKERCGLCGVCDFRKPRSNTDNSNCFSSSKGKLSAENPTQNHTAINIDNFGVNSINNAVNINNKKSDPSIFRMLFSFCKEGSAVFHGHLSLIEIFSLSLRRANIPVKYTRGFNPLPKLEFASPIATGLKGDFEIASVDFTDKISKDDFISGMNKKFPEGISIKTAECFYIKSGMKQHSLASLLWGFSYQNPDGNLDFVNKTNDKVYKQGILNEKISLMDMRRREVLARNIPNSVAREWASYFDVFKFLYQ